MADFLEEQMPRVSDCTGQPEDVPPADPQVIPALLVDVLTAVTKLYIGAHARLVATDTGVRLEIQNSGGDWIEQITYSEE